MFTKSATESIPQIKIDWAASQLADIQGKTWNTPEEFKILFPHFDSDVRMALPRMINENRTPDSLKVLDMVNFINYLGTTYGSIEHRSIGSELLQRLFPSSSPDQRLSYIVDSIKLWVRVMASKMAVIKEALQKEIGGEAGRLFMENLSRLKTIDGCMKLMLSCRKHMNEDDVNESINYEYLESTIQLVAHILSNNYEEENEDIYKAWLNTTDDLKEGLEKDMDDPSLPEEWLTIPEEYDRSASQTLNETYERSEEQKLTVFISLAKMYAL